MNAKQMREQLIGVPDEAVLLAPDSDHGYRLVEVELTTAIAYPMGYRGRSTYDEDHGDEHMDPGGKRVPALLFR